LTTSIYEYVYQEQTSLQLDKGRQSPCSYFYAYKSCWSWYVHAFSLSGF